jgi:hypothetical protein
LSAVKPSSRPISSTILPSITFSTVVPVNALQRVLEQHVRRGDLDDRKIDILAPELGKPAGDDRLVIPFLAHWNPPLDVS